MPPLGDDSPTWEVLPNPKRGEETEPYRPPLADRLDPVVLTGRADTRAGRAKDIGRAVFIALLVGAPLASLGPRSVGWYVVTGSLMVAIVLVRLVSVLRRPMGGRPTVAVDSEGLTVTDVHGVTRTTTWSAVTAVYLGWYSSGQARELYVSWVDATGENVGNNLGQSLELEAVHVALLARHVPQGVTVRIGPQRARRSLWSSLTS